MEAEVGVNGVGGFGVEVHLGENHPLVHTAVRVVASFGEGRQCRIGVRDRTECVGGQA